MLELFARLGLINRYPLLMSHLEWLQSQQAKDGRWNLPTKLLERDEPLDQPDAHREGLAQPRAQGGRLTFRMLLILRHQWERQIRMLDRRDDGYPI